MRDKRNRIAGLVAWDKNAPTVMKGWRLRVETADKQTSDLFLKAPGNVSYLSWRVQNQIIYLMGDAIQSKFFPIFPNSNTFRYLRMKPLM